MGWRSNRGQRIPERFTTARMVIRLWQPDDAQAMRDALAADVEHLARWLDWARHEPKSVEEKRAYIESSRQEYFKVGGRGGATYGLFSPDECEVWGSIGYHHRIGEGAREIGYWIRSSRANQGLMTEAAGALTWIGLNLMKLGRLEIQCDPANLPSSRVPAKLGYRLHATMHRQVKGMKLSPRSTMVWAMGPREFPGTPAAGFAPVTIADQPVAAFIEAASQV